MLPDRGGVFQAQKNLSPPVLFFLLSFFLQVNNSFVSALHVRDACCLCVLTV